jgi:hypothetical protein
MVAQRRGQTERQRHVPQPPALGDRHLTVPIGALDAELSFAEIDVSPLERDHLVASQSGFAAQEQDRRRRRVALYSGEMQPPRSAASASATMAAAAQPLQLDLRNYSVSRTDEQTPKQQPVRLVRGSLNLTILLPVGSEPGPYDAQLLDSSLRSLASTSGQARIEDFVTTLPTTMDLRSVPSGTYQLALRHQGDDWRLFPALVK